MPDPNPDPNSHLMRAGVLLAVVVLAVSTWTLQRQGDHIAANEEMAREVYSLSNELGYVKGDVAELRRFTDEVRARAEASSESNRRRLEAVEKKAPQ